MVRYYSQDGFKALSDLIRQFDDQVSAIVKTETDVWIAEFRAGNEQLEQYFKSKLEQQRPGDLQVSITDYQLYSSVELLINDKSVGIITGGTKLISSLPPDNYEISIKATAVKAGQVLEKKSVATIKPAAITVIDIKIS